LVGLVSLVGLLVWGLIVGGLPAWGGTLRAPAVAGAFYPGTAEALGPLVEGLLARAPAVEPAATASRLVGLIVPHAGYQYSGPTAALGFKSVAGQTFDRVYFLGVDHRSGRPTVSLWADGGYDTPLGPVPADATTSQELLVADPALVVDPRQHVAEHSLEVLLPFYLKTVGARPAVFLSVGGPPENGLRLGDLLRRHLAGVAGRVLIVASTDWSHYHDAATAQRLDQVGIDAVLALDAPRLLEACRRETTELCGLNGVLALTTLMKAAGGRARLLARTDSSAASGDTSQVVGYAAILCEAEGLPASTPAIDRQEHSPPESSPPGSGTGSGPVRLGQGSTPETATATREEEAMNEMHKEALAAVRTTLEAVLAGRPRPALTFRHPRFAEKCGVFVTLKKHGELRGCIGLLQGVEPLGEAIQEMAVAAATRDPRFPQVTLDELKEIDIEISVLSPMIPVANLDEIVVGRDGLLLKKGFRSGVLLPQVATEYGWDRDTFLEHLCLKAGLPPGSHKAPDAQLLRFTAEVFGEKEP
jgi:AmmeMemoRadiSam system protein B/AmmeMemoRadiSam system protein A